MDLQTILIIAAIAVAIIFLAWRVYISLKRYSCCGTCGCDLMSKKERKAFDERRAALAQQAKNKLKKS